MKERITKYLKYMDELLEKLKKSNNNEYAKDDESGKNNEVTDSIENLEDIMKNHMTQIGFFMHERMIHLIVTFIFAVGAFMTIFTYLIVENVGLLLLALLIIVLLVPYIKHYYLLENGVQKMYKQYDELLELIRNKKSL